MSDTPAVSVIMPIYKAEKYVRLAIESILCQTFLDFELILINDCSPDGCGSVCDEYASQDDRVVVIHLPRNKGVSHARNAGLSIAKGRYVTFMDADDYMDAGGYQAAWDFLSRFPDFQTVMWGLTEEYLDIAEHAYLIKPMVMPAQAYYGEEEVRKAVIEMERQTLFGYTVNKLYSGDILRSRQIRFDEDVKINEDFLFNMAYVRWVRSWGILQIAPYHYKKRCVGSATAAFLPDYFPLHQGRVQMVLELYDEWQMLTDSVRDSLNRMYVRYIFSAMERNCDPRTKMSHKDRVRWMNSLFNDPSFGELMISTHHPGILGWMERMLQSRNSRLCLVGGRLVFLIKSRLPGVFARLKQKR